MKSIHCVHVIVQMIIYFSVPVVAQSAPSRSVWVLQQIANFNRPFAIQLPREVEKKMSKMASCPFLFYRGSAHLFFQDMKTLPPSKYDSKATAKTWINGDMHLLNIGATRDAEHQIVYDTNDFDEGYWGPYSWDLRRMAVSIVLAARENQIEPNERKALVEDFVDAYLAQISDFASNGTEREFRLTSDNTTGAVQKLLVKAAHQTSDELLNKYTDIGGGRPRRFKEDSELLKVTAAKYAAVRAAVRDYVHSIPNQKRAPDNYYTVKDVRLKLGSGTGSLGRYLYYALIEGKSPNNGDDVILQVKQETASVVALAAADNMPAVVYHGYQGRRAALSMRTSLNAPDDLVGWTRMNGMDFLVREKAPIDAPLKYTKLSYDEFSKVAKYVGQVVAKNHAMPNKEFSKPWLAADISKKIDAATQKRDGVKKEMVEFALEYADQVKLDFQSLYADRNKNLPMKTDDACPGKDN